MTSTPSTRRQHDGVVHPTHWLMCAQVDTLKPASFDGSKPSRYGRRGHIRTAVNVPYTSLLDEAGCFLPEPELRRAFAGVGDEPVLAY